MGKPAAVNIVWLATIWIFGSDMKISNKNPQLLHSSPFWLDLIKDDDDDSFQSSQADPKSRHQGPTGP